MRRALRFAAPVALALLLAPAPARSEAVIQSSYSFSGDGAQTWTDEGMTATQKYKHTIDVKYRGFLQPVVENEFTMKVEWEQGDEALKYVKMTPLLTLKYKGSYWNSGVKRGIEESTEPGKGVKYSDKAFVELVFAPPRETLPDLKAKYTGDKDFEEGSTNTVKHGFVASTDYKPFDWLTLKADWTRNLAYDRLKEDSDTEDEKVSGSVGLRRLVGRKLRFQAEYRVDDSRGATQLTDGGATNQKRDQSHTWKNAVTFLYLPDGILDASYDYELKQRMVDPWDHDLKRTYKVMVDQKFRIVGDLSMKAQFDRVETETRGKADGDTLKTEDTWTGEAKTKPHKFADLTFRTTWKRTTDALFPSPAGPTTGSSFQRSASWNCDLFPFFKPSVSADRTSSYSWDKTLEREVLSTVTTSYSMSGPIAVAIPLAEITPAYTLTFTDDLLADDPKLRSTVVRDFSAKASSTIVRTRNLDGKVEHSYARKEDTKVGNIVRTDASTVDVQVREILPGWNMGAAVSRNATDTSGDDLGVDVTEAVTLKGDLNRAPLKTSFAYKYDRTLTEGKYDKYSIDAAAGWTTDRWDVSLTGNYKRTLSPAVDKGFTLSLTFNFKL